MTFRSILVAAAASAFALGAAQALAQEPPPLPLPDGVIRPNLSWLELGINKQIHIDIAAPGARPYVDPRLPNTKAAEGYFRAVFAQPRQTASGAAYDRVLTHDIFYCGAARYALVELDYYMGDKLVQRVERPSTLYNGEKTYSAADVSSGSVNEIAYREACAVEPPAQSADQ